MPLPRVSVSWFLRAACSTSSWHRMVLHYRQSLIIHKVLPRMDCHIALPSRHFEQTPRVASLSLFGCFYVSDESRGLAACRVG